MYPILVCVYEEQLCVTHWFRASPAYEFNLFLIVLIQEMYYNTNCFALDLDQIVDDLLPHNMTKLEKQPVDPDLPGLGQHYCVPCSRYFVDSRALMDHRKTKPHKNRVKALKEDIYTGPAVKIDNGAAISRKEETPSS